MMGVRMNGIIVFSVLLLFVQFQKTFEASTSPCQPGFYYNGGHCIPCAPCPKSLKDRNKWYNEECLVAFYDCPRLCTQRFPDWSSDELADDKICDDLGYQYTTEPSSTTNGVTTIPSTTTVQTPTNQDHTTLSEALTYAAIATPKLDTSVSGGRTLDLKWIYAIGSVISALFVMTSVYWYMRCRNEKDSNSSTEENIISTEENIHSSEEIMRLISDICRNCSIKTTSSTSISVKCMNAQIDNGVSIKLWYEQKELKTKSFNSSEDMVFGFCDGMRPGKSFTLEFVAEGDGDQEGGERKSVTMPGFLSSVESSSSTTVTAHCYSKTDNFRVVLYDTEHKKEIRLDSKINCHQAAFDEKNGVLPGRKYKVQAVETFDSGWRDEHGHPWKEEQPISTPAWTFHAKADGERIQITNLPDDTAAQAMRKKYSGSCFVDFCPCVRSLNGGQRYWLPESGSSFSVDYPFSEWTSMPVRLCIQTSTEEHVAGELMIENQRSDRGEEAEPTKCETQFTGVSQDLRQDLAKSLNPQTFERFCLMFIQLCNKLAGNNKEQFSEDLAKAQQLTGDQFLDQISPTFAHENMRNTTIYQLVQGLVTKEARQWFSNALDLFVGAILRHHDCSACRALIHKVLHEEELLNAHPAAVVSVNDETLSPCESQRNEALTMETTIGDFDDVSDTSDCNTNGNAICLQTINGQVSNGSACHVGTPV